jgi:hypothetical protein
MRLPGATSGRLSRPSEVLFRQLLIQFHYHYLNAEAAGVGDLVMGDAGSNYAVVNCLGQFALDIEGHPVERLRESARLRFKLQPSVRR